MAKPIASYFASVGMDVDPKAIANVDAFLGKLKQRLDKFQTFANSQKALQFTGTLRYKETRTAINTQLAKIGENLVLPIKNVKIIGKDAKAGIQGSLAKTAFNIRVNGKFSRESIDYMKAQLHTAFANTTVNVRSRVSIPNRMPRGAAGGGGGWLGGLLGGGGKGGSGGSSGLLGMLGRGAGAAGKGSMAARLLGGLGGGVPGLGLMGLGAVNSIAGASTSLFTAPFKAIGSVLEATSNSIMRAGMKAIPLIGGAYGLGKLNEANDNYQGQRMASDAIFSSGNYGVTGKDARDWLMKAAMRDGFNYRDTMPQFNGFMASAMPLMGYEKSRNTFESFTQFGRTRGATNESMGRALYALQQMAGKGTVMSEELNQQLAEAQGFAESKSIFAEAYQRHLNKGGPAKLTGEKAISALTEAMKKGKVKSSEVFPYVTDIMKERSASGIDDARNLSSSQQARFMNSRQLFLQQFSDNGGEEGFSTFWKTMAQGMERITAMAPQLGNYFKGASEIVSGLFLALGEVYDFVTTGEMTSVAQWLQDNGINVLALREDILSMITEVKKQFTELFGESSLGERAMAVMKAVFDTGLIKEYVLYLKQTADIYMNLAAAAQAAFSGRWGDAAGHLKAVGSTYVDRLGTNLRVGGATYEVLSAAVQGSGYMSPNERNYAQESKDLKERPLWLYEQQTFQDGRGMGYSEWVAWKQKQLDETAASMAGRNTYKFAPAGPAQNSYAFKPGTGPMSAPWSPPALGVPSIQEMSANPQGSFMTDLANSLQNQQIKHNVDVKVNLNLDVKTDESQLGMRVSDAVKTELGAALGAQLQSVMINIPKY